MRVLKSFFIAFSLYSKIPVPQFAWREEDMKYVFCFFPWVGAVTGAFVYGWLWVCDRCLIGRACCILTAAAIPLLVTGGFHVDGFLDTMDALHSYRPREKKLEILKDPHIGAFAVIAFAVWGMLYLGVLSEIRQRALWKILCSGFFLARCLCGISAVSFPLAKKDGMLFHTADRAEKRAVKGALYLQSAVCIGFMLHCCLFAGTAAVGGALGALFYYFCRSKKEFGGVTGDTAGFFVVLCEGCMAAAVAAADIFLRGGR